MIYARRGAPEFVDAKDFFCCFNAPRREHSRKPDEFYDLVRRVADGPRIDMFSRERRDGFDQWGDETDRFVDTALPGESLAELDPPPSRPFNGVTSSPASRRAPPRTRTRADQLPAWETPASRTVLGRPLGRARPKA